MNSGLFTNSVMSIQNPFANGFEDQQSSPFGQSLQSLFGNAFQTDGSQMQTIDAFGGNGASGSVPPGLFAAIAQAISQYFGGASQGGDYEQASWPSGDRCGKTTPFTDANIASVGDPHDSINGTQTTGVPVSSRWDDMQSHPNLLSAPSIAGGLHLSSQVGTANAQGATMNRSITATANHGNTKISFDADGHASVEQGSIKNTMVKDETLQLGNGLSVTDQGNSLLLRARNANGGTLTTTLTDNGQGGIDVNAQAQNIALGGYLVNSSSQMQ